VDELTLARTKPLEYAKFVEAGWQGLNAEAEYGGAGFPEAVFTCALEFMTAANGALTMCPGLTTGAIFVGECDVTSGNASVDMRCSASTPLLYSIRVLV
jgi:alkylation response protein AidB-like acyl-CoA dehydrogenase